MEQFRQEIETYFKRYEQQFRDGMEGKEVDLDAITGAFANCFVEASPVGVMCSQNDEKLRQSIPKGYRFYRDIGATAMTIEHKEVTLLDEYHAMVKVHWLSGYKKDGKEISIAFDIFYLLQYLHEELKMFAYITGDERKVLKEHGLI
jgi:hypothetical protein